MGGCLGSSSANISSHWRNSSKARSSSGYAILGDEQNIPIVRNARAQISAAAGTADSNRFVQRVGIARARWPSVATIVVQPSLGRWMDLLGRRPAENPLGG